MGLFDKLLSKDDASRGDNNWLAKLDQQAEGVVGDVNGAEVNGHDVNGHDVNGHGLNASESQAGVDINEHFATLEILPGSSWEQVAAAHAQACENLGENGSLSERRKINAAYAALRLHGQPYFVS